MIFFPIIIGSANMILQVIVTFILFIIMLIKGEKEKCQQYILSCLLILLVGIPICFMSVVGFSGEKAGF